MAALGPMLSRQLLTSFRRDWDLGPHPARQLLLTRCLSHLLSSAALASARRSGREATLDLKNTAPPIHYLAQLDGLVAQARQCQKPVCTRPRPRRVPNQSGEWPCADCGRFLARDAFAKSRSRCRECSSVAYARYRCTLRGNAAVLLGSARRRALRKDMLFDLGIEHVFDMLLAQRGRCAYSALPMEILLPHSHWRMSLERKNNLQGYTIQNCALICLEFNSPDFSRPSGMRRGDVQGTAQWSAEKVKLIGNAASLRVDMQLLSKDLREAAQAFGSERHLRCRNLRHRAMRMASRAKFRSASKGLPCDVTFKDILDMLWMQRGRCFYSGIPLQYKASHVDWVMSLERLNNKRGYVQDNCFLIAAEFNTTDHSSNSHAVGEVRGSGQWSLAKVQHAWGA